MHSVYKVDVKGKVRFKTISSDGPNLIIEYGVVGGKSITKSKECVEKSKGKSNYTTAEDQAKIQITRKYKLCIREGYYDTREEAIISSGNNEVIQAAKEAAEKAREEAEKVYKLAKIEYKSAYQEFKIAYEEAKSIYEEAVKVAEYYRDYPKKSTKKLIKPMLAKPFKPKSLKFNKVTDNIFFIQPKLDGMRCLAFITVEDDTVNVVLKSRKNVVIDSVEHVVKDLKEIFKSEVNGFSVILDGELYIHGENFQTNMSYIKKYKKGFTERVLFCVYDVVKDCSIKERLNYISKVLKNRLLSVNVVETAIVTTDNIEELLIQLEKEHKFYVDKKFEGIMLRPNYKEGYQPNKRSKALLKYKKFIDEVGIIIDVIPSKSCKTLGQPIIKMNGKTFGAGVKLTVKEREELLTNKEKYIGKIAEIRFFEYYASGIPRFPIYHGIREDK